MDVRLSCIDKVDKKAITPITYLIMSFIENHPNVGCIEIGKDEISFTKGYFFTIGKIKYAPYGLSCVNGVVCYDGAQDYSVPNNNRAYLLVNILLQIRRGQMSRI